MWLTIRFAVRGTDLEIKEARHRKDREMQLFKDIADMKKIKDKETFLQVLPHLCPYVLLFFTKCMTPCSLF